MAGDFCDNLLAFHTSLVYNDLDSILWGRGAIPHRRYSLAQKHRLAREPFGMIW